MSRRRLLRPSENRTTQTLHCVSGTGVASADSRVADPEKIHLCLDTSRVRRFRFLRLRAPLTFFCQLTQTDMASPFTAPPAGTPVPPNTSARYYTRSQVFSRVPVNKDNFTSGKQASFILE